MYSFIPRSAACCSLELMTGAAKLARKYGAYLQTHLSESLEDLSWVKDLHPGFRDYTEVYHRTSVLGPKTIVAHAIHLGDRELTLLAKTNTSIAHCPSSNLLLNAGIMDIEERVQRGIRVGLGTDVGAGPSLSLFREMAIAGYASRASYIMRRVQRRRLAQFRDRFKALGPGGTALYRSVASGLGLHKSSKVVNMVFAFYLATLGGARALGLDNVIGNFARAKEADFVVVDPSKATPPVPYAENQPISVTLAQLAHRGDRRMVSKTYVRGKEVYSES